MSVGILQGQVERYAKQLAPVEPQIKASRSAIPGRFLSVSGRLVFCRIRDYLPTLQGLPLLATLEQVLLSHPVSPAL